MKHVDHPIIVYLVISLVSLASATLLFFAGGSLAEIVGDDNSVFGFGFKAGGGIAGFILIFTLSQKAVLRLYERKDGAKANQKVYLQGDAVPFVRGYMNYSGTYEVFNSVTGDTHSVETKPFWEAGYLTVFVKDVGDDDYLTIHIHDQNGGRWISESFHSRSPKIASLSKI